MKSNGFPILIAFWSAVLPTVTATEIQFYQEHGAANPFRISLEGRFLTAGDLNGDGKLDLLTVGDGEVYGGPPGQRLVAWFNNGTAASASFLPDALTYGPSFLFEASPVLADLDGDGDPDLIGGADDGTMRYFQNSGPTGGWAFAELTGTANPLNGINLTGNPEPAVVDIDGDGDNDVVVVDESARRLVLLRNTGTPTTPAFTRQAFSPFSTVVVDDGPGFADLDGDGDQDLFATSASSPPNPDRMNFYRNTGTATSANFTLDNTPLAVVSGTGLGGSHPVLADFNADGDIDLLAGAAQGGPCIFLSGAVPPPTRFVEETTTGYPFPQEPLLGNFTAGDLDGDGDQDLIGQTPESTLVVLRNSGTATAPVWSPWPGTSPVAGSVSNSSRPELLDVDRDGDLDLFALDASSPFWQYFRNTGTATAAGFTLQTAANNPLDLLTGDTAGLLFADPDGDGDSDIVGSHNQPGDFTSPRYYRNNGSGTAPLWEEAESAENPFENVRIDYAEPTLADMDGDGDSDLLVGGRGKLVYWRNQGTRTAPDFVQVSAAESPFASIGGLGSARVVPLLGEWKNGGAADLLLWQYDDLSDPARVRFFTGVVPTTSNGYATWQAANFSLPAEAGIAAAGEDPDKDGVVNLIEYAVRTPPKIPGKSPGTATRNAAGVLQLEIDVRDDDPTLSAVGQSGATLSSLAGNLLPTITNPAPGNGLRRWIFTDQPPGGSNPRRFLRAKFSLAP